MNQTQFIAEIAAPDHVSIMPSVWLMLLIALVLIVSGVLTGYLVRRYRRRAPVRAANKVLRSLHPALPDLAVQTQALLKRTALAYAPRNQVAALSEQQWYQWLDSHLPAAKQGRWPQLMGNPYARQSAHGGQQLLDHTRLTLNALIDAKAGAKAHIQTDDR